VPTYQLKCKKCGHKFDEFAKVKDRLKIKCEKCGGDTQIMILPRPFHIFKPFWHPNLASKPVWIKSKEHLKQEAKKRKMTAYY